MLQAPIRLSMLYGHPVPTQVRKTFLHRRPHWDECVAVALLSIAHPDVEIMTMDEARAITAYGDDPTVTLVGMGGRWADEHKKDVGRLPNECATTLVAKGLGFEAYQEYRLLLEEVLRADTRKDADGEESGQTRLELGEVIKTLHGWLREAKPGARDLDLMVVEFVRQLTLAHLAAMHSKPFKRMPLPALRITNPNLSLGSDDGEKPILSKIVLPAYAGLQDLAKVKLITRFAPWRWRVMGDLEVVHVTSQEELDQYAQRSNVVFVGIEGGQFPTEMLASDVAGFFGVSKRARGDQLLWWNRVGYFVKELDRYRAPDRKHGAFELDTVIANLNYYGDLTTKQVMDRVSLILECYIMSGREFWELCPQDFADNGGQIVEVAGVRIGIVETDLIKMNAWLRSRMNCQVVVIRRKTDDVVSGRKRGNTAIFTANKFKTLMPFIARQILRAEARKLGMSDKGIAQADFMQAFEKIVAEGLALDLPKPAHHWYFFWVAGMLLNGSLSHAQRPTALSDEELLEALASGVEDWRLVHPAEEDEFVDAPTEEKPSTSPESSGEPSEEPDSEPPDESEAETVFN